MEKRVDKLVIEGVTYVPEDSIKNQAIPFSEINSIEDMVGKAFYFRLMTYHMLGKVVKIIGGEILQLENASWIPDSGRFMNAIKNGTLLEIEPVGTTFIFLRNTNDWEPWIHPLPTEQK